MSATLRRSYAPAVTYIFRSNVVQDIPENGADIAHLTYLHGTGVSSGSGTDFKDLPSGKLHSHEWSVKWEAQPPPTSHIGRMTLKLTNIVFGMKIKALDFHVTADQVSP